MSTHDAVILFAHGARDPQWAQPFEEIRRRMLVADPRLDVTLAYLELMTPSLEDAVDALVAQGRMRIRLVPLFMAQGGHLRRDLPQKILALQARHAGIIVDVSPPIGEVPDILDSISSWVLRQV